MEKIVSRPKNEDIGIPLRDRRVPIQMTEDEHAELKAAADREGLNLSSYIRAQALKAARSE